MTSYVETTAVALRKGNTQANENFTGVYGELVADMGNTQDGVTTGTDISATLRLHNGITPGGIPMMRADAKNISTAVLAENRQFFDDVNLAYASLSNLEVTTDGTTQRNIIDILGSYGLAKTEDIIIYKGGTGISIDEVGLVTNTLPHIQSDWYGLDYASGQILNRPNLSTVATTGSYNDLLNKLIFGDGIVQTIDNEIYVTNPLPAPFPALDEGINKVLYCDGTNLTWEQSVLAGEGIDVTGRTVSLITPIPTVYDNTNKLLQVLSNEEGENTTTWVDTIFKLESFSATDPTTIPEDGLYYFNTSDHYIYVSIEQEEDIFVWEKYSEPTENIMYYVYEEEVTYFWEGSSELADGKMLVLGGGGGSGSGGMIINYGLS